VNAGSYLYIDGAGVVWATDRAYLLGNWGYLGGTTYSTGAVIASTADQPLYRTARLWSASALPGYRFPLPNGPYWVRLKFAEIYWSAPDKRKFTVRAEGAPILSDFDIYAAAGGKYIAADREFRVEVTDGELTLDFIKLAGYDNPMVNAIEVFPAAP